jgi:phosphate transport system protein
MPRREYQESLEALRDDVTAMGEAVLEQVYDGLEALEDGDRSRATAVIDGDEAINDRYLELEAACIDLFALQQPVASDLRFIAASFKILTDLERIGDLATNLGHYTLAAETHHVADEAVYQIGADAATLVADALEAYTAEDAEACYRIAARDDDIDDRCHRASERIVREILDGDHSRDPSVSTETLMDDVSRSLLTIRDLERVADHGVNIAARTLYLVDSNPELIY